jgi:glycosyltransferase involved in cell wall biosynthesis
MPDLAVSVIIPVFNGAPFLARAVESIRRQRYAPLEIVVVDDGSTDDTAGVVARLAPDARFARQINAGPAAARNHGLRIATGDVIAFLDVDDAWPDATLASQTAVLAERPSVAIVQGTIREERADGSVLEPYFNVNLGSFVFRRSVFDAIGGFDETLRTGEDVDLVIRAWEHGLSKIARPEVALVYHRHDAAMTDGVNRKLVFAALLKRRLARRRAGEAAAPPHESVADYIGWRQA